MTTAVPDVLARIADHKKVELKARLARREPLEPLAEASIATRRDFRAALELRSTAIIAEIKKASPSKGLLSSHFDPAAIASAYQAGGAAALSVLTDETFFQGSLDDLEAARAAVRLPVLRKDFTIDEFHVMEAAAHGADAILLIVAILTPRQLRDFRELAGRYRMAALVEIHSEDEARAAVDSGAGIIGVNNRDLHTFHVTLDTSLRLAAHIPQGVLKISESGIHSAAAIALLQAAGYRAFLVGEHLMTAGQPAAALKALIG